MEISLFLAKVMGLCLILFGISMFIARSHYSKILKDLANHPGLILLAGSFNLVIGVLIIVSHNVWRMDWPVLITIIGWLLLIRGLLWTAFPKFIMTRMTRISDRSAPLYTSIFVIIILGVILCFLGFK